MPLNVFGLVQFSVRLEVDVEWRLVSEWNRILNEEKGGAGSCFMHINKLNK